MDKVVCPECDGTGVTENKGKEKACNYCKGKGEVPKELANDSEEV
jgi:DnaJ-class molecular chaperone